MRLVRLGICCCLLFIVGCEPAARPKTPDPCVSNPASCQPPPPPGPKLVDGCAGARLIEKPSDPAKAGPWVVGTRTISLPYVTKNGDDAAYTIEILYPAQPGSEKDKEKVRFDLRKQLPDGEQQKIPDAANPWQACNCYRELALDQERGPYPVVLFIHGTGGFRTQSLAHMVHWASRGFVVVAADHPGIKLGDVLALKLSPQQAKDASFILDALRETRDGFAFLQSRIDVERMAVAGHSAGGSALAGLGAEKGVQVLIPMAAGGADPANPPKSTLILGGKDDQIVPYTRQQEGYASSPKVKRLVGLDNAGHLAFSDLCVVGRAQGGLIKIAIQYKVKIPESFQSLIEKLATDGCLERQLKAEQGWEVIHFATSAVLEETLHCDATMAKTISEIKTRYPEVHEFQEEK